VQLVLQRGGRGRGDGGGRICWLTIYKGIENVFPVLLHQVVDVSEDSTRIYRQLQAPDSWMCLAALQCFDGVGLPHCCSTRGWLCPN